MSEQDDGDELQTWPDHARLIEVTLDEASIGRNNAEVEHEREVAIFDLLEKNRFALEAHDAGPYTLRLSLADNRLVFTVADEAREPIQHVMLSLSPFRRIVKDYFLICDSITRRSRPSPPPRSRRSTWGGAACTTKAAACCWSGSRARSTSISPPRGACSRCSARCTGRAEARRGPPRLSAR